MMIKDTSKAPAASDTARNIIFPVDQSTFESLRSPVPLTKRDAFIYCGADALAVFIAFFGVLLALGPSDLPIGWMAAGTTVWALAIFCLLGLYRQLYCIFPRDEFYYSIVALGLALTPILVLLAVLPQTRILLPTLCAGFGIAALLMGGSRSWLFRRSAESRRGTTDSLPALPKGSVLLVKRIIDVIIGAIGLIVFLPLMMLTAACIYLESGLPVLFTQERIGLRGKVFRILKFRTMQMKAGDQWALPGDQRITRLGSTLRRLSIDELPQVVNVLKGDMSVVGPRPEMSGFAEEFGKRLKYYHERHSVQPGLTGWAQVYMKRNLTPADAEAVLLHDLFYVAHRSFYLDLVLICKTAAEFLFHRAV